MARSLLHAGLVSCCVSYSGAVSLFAWREILHSQHMVPELEHAAQVTAGFAHTRSAELQVEDSTTQKLPAHGPWPSWLQISPDPLATILEHRTKAVAPGVLPPGVFPRYSLMTDSSKHKLGKQYPNAFNTWSWNAPDPYPNSSAYPLKRNHSEENEPFVKVRTKKTHNTTTIEVQVEIANPNIIVSVYLLMFVPLVMAWASMFHFNTVEEHYPILLPITLCSTIVGQDLVNQSLSALMNAPFAITGIQACSMTIITGAWVLSTCPRPAPGRSWLWPLFRWSSVAIMFTVYQLLNHLVSYYCSLSERTIFLNLCPLAAMAVESIMPSTVRKEVSWTSKMALFSMAFGAILFGLQYPDFSNEGVRAVSMLVAIIIPYRLLQRWCLADCGDIPVAALAFYDGLFLAIPSSMISAHNINFWAAWEIWFKTPSISLMLLLSWITFTAGHICALLLLRQSSATTFLVFHNIANFVVVFEGIMFFGDQVMQAPLVFSGIIISLCGGVWYSLLQRPGLPKQVEWCMDKAERAERGVQVPGNDSSPL